MKQLFKQIFEQSIRRLFNGLVSIVYIKQYRQQLKINNIPNRPVDGEVEWAKKWSVLGKANPIYYRLFSHYIGHNINIIPEDICRNIVEPILDPLRYAAYYSDKNIFDKLFKPGTLAKTIFRKMGGFYYDDKYNRIALTDNNTLLDILTASECQKIVIKPTVDSCSGRGVKLFQNNNGKWQDLSSNDVLTLEYLNRNYGTNFIVQECLVQADFMAYYNPTSVNTLRLTLYRSVKTDECHIPSAIIRIGKNGSLVDNAHAGGGYVGIHTENGELCKSVLDQDGRSANTFNGIDFSQEHKIPNWDKVVEFAKYIGSQVPHHRLLALDIMVDKSGNPRLIEFNCEAYGMWLFQFTMGAALGEYTDEIIEYCKNNLDKAQRIIKA